MSQSIKVSPDTLLEYAKTKSGFKEQKNIKDAKKFSDITSGKQKILIKKYKERTLLEYAKKSNLVKNAKTFSDLTPTQRKIVIQAYKKDGGKISSKGSIGGIGVVKKPERVDTSKGNMGKEVSITEGKQFREMFKGGAKITWLEHVKKFREANPELSYKDALKEATKTYTPMRKREREQQKVDTAVKKESFVKKPRKLTKKQVALRFYAYGTPDDRNAYKEEFEKVWNEKIKGKRFKDNEELLEEMKKHYSR